MKLPQLKNSFLSLVLLVIIICFGACRNDFEFRPTTQGISFSRDTVYLDTVFTNIGSSTFNLKVYNRSNQDISIPSVALARGETSSYRLNVDGRSGKSFDNVEIFANDSIFIFVETTVDIEQQASDALEFLYEDQIVFKSNDNQEQVTLLTLIKDAVFLFPQTNDQNITESILLDEDEEGNEISVEGFFLEDQELVFTNEKPYVIYGYAAVPPEKTLTIQAGARIHFHKDSGIFVSSQASLQVNGALSADQELLEKEVIFEGDRLETIFDNVPGQWGAIWISEGSTNNSINHATIKNGTIGILTDSSSDLSEATLKITNSQIFNHSAFGLLGRTASVSAGNSVFGNAGRSSVYVNLGGSYNFTQCTIANYWQNSMRNTPALQIDNFSQTDQDTQTTADLEIANFNNCIIFGNNSNEFFVNAVADAAFNFRFQNSLIRLEAPPSPENNPLFNFTNTSLYTNVLLNEAPDFLDPSTQQFNIGEESAANGTASPLLIGIFTTDIIGTPRNITQPDMGAYESVMFPESIE